VHEAERARRLVAAYATCFDRGDIDALGALFAPDGRLVLGGGDGGGVVLVGAAAIGARLRTGWVPGRRHVNSLSVVGDGWATTDWVMYRGRDVARAGRYHDRFRDGRFAERRIRYDEPGPPVPAAAAGGVDPQEEPMVWPTDPHDGVRRTLARYGQLADDRRIAAVAELFTEDAVLEVRGRAWRGRAEIVARGGDGPDPGLRTKHVTVNAVVDVADDGATASVATDFLYFVAPPDGPWALRSTGRYRDRHVLEADGCWRIAERVVLLD
jgi:3-phenylpropionate/cinnamic acid dioxygenase small subunit